MKKEQVLELLKKAVGDNEIDVSKIDVDSITKEWNDSINGAIKAETERAKEATKKELLSNLGYESEEDVKQAIEATKTNEEKENEKLTTLEKRLQTMEEDLQKKDKELQTTKQKDVLRGLKIKDDKLDKAYKLIASEVSEELDFETAAQNFIKETPEWLDSKDNRTVTLDDKHDGGEDKEEDSKILEEAWG